jgi:hypothetical protein
MRTLCAVLVYRDEKFVKATIRENITLFELSTVHRVLQSGCEVTKHTSQSIVQTSCRRQPSEQEDQYFQSDIKERSISGLVVLEALFDRHGRSLFLQRSILLSVFQNIPETVSTAGWVWEGQCHRCFCIGGEFTLFAMRVQGNSLIQGRKPETLSVGTMDTIPLVPGVVATRNPGEYYISTAKNNPTFDACFLSDDGGQMALQMTLSFKHSIKSAGFDKLEELRPTTCDKRAFVFVVPKKNAHLFTCPKPADDAQKKFTYYVLPLEPNESKYCPSSEAYKN